MLDTHDSENIGHYLAGPLYDRVRQNSHWTADQRTGARVERDDEQRQAMEELYREPYGVLPGSLYDFNSAEAQKEAVVEATWQAMTAAGVKVDRQEVNEFVARWAVTSNGESMRSLGIQEVADEVFGTELSAWQRAQIERARTSRQWSTQAYPFQSTDIALEHLASRRADAKAKIAAALRAMKQHTEEWLKDYPYETVTLYRGYRTQETDLPLPGEVFAYDDNSLASWTTDFMKAKSFTYLDGSGWAGMVGSAEIPVERILCTARTGLGCGDEREFVVLGSPEPTYAKVVARREWSRDQLRARVPVSAYKE